MFQWTAAAFQISHRLVFFVRESRVIRFDACSTQAGLRYIFSLTEAPSSEPLPSQPRLSVRILTKHLIVLKLTHIAN